MLTIITSPATTPVGLLIVIEVFVVVAEVADPRWAISALALLLYNEIKITNVSAAALLVRNTLLLIKFCFIVNVK
jgi:hypothetical protein